MIAALSSKFWVFQKHHSYFKATYSTHVALGGGTEKYCASSTGGYENCASTGYKNCEMKNSEFRMQCLISNIRRLKHNLIIDKKRQQQQWMTYKRNKSANNTVEYIAEAGNIREVPHQKAKWKHFCSKGFNKAVNNKKSFVLVENGNESVRCDLVIYGDSNTFCDIVVDVQTKLDYK